MLSPDKRRRLTQLLGMIGSNADNEALTAAKMAQRLIGSECLTWEEVLNDAGGSKSYTDGYNDGFRVGLARGAASAANDKFKPIPTGWQDLAAALLAEFQLTEWEQGFCQSFVDRGWSEPTPKQAAVFERMAKKFDVDLPD